MYRNIETEEIHEGLGSKSKESDTELKLSDPVA